MQRHTVRAAIQRCFDGHIPAAEKDRDAGVLPGAVLAQRRNPVVNPCRAAVRKNEVRRHRVWALEHKRAYRLRDGAYARRPSVSG